jgi:hypothetical protein
MVTAFLYCMYGFSVSKLFAYMSEVHSGYSYSDPDRVDRRRIRIIESDKNEPFRQILSHSNNDNSRTATASA